MARSGSSIITDVPPTTAEEQRLRGELLLIHQEIERHSKSGILEWDERKRWRSVLARTRKVLGL